MNKLQKLLFIPLAISFFGVNANAQNSFPSSGNAGVGTSNPQSAFQIGEYYGNNQSKLTFPGVYNFEKTTLGQAGNGGAFLEFVNHTSMENSYAIRIGANVDSYGQGLYIVGAPSTTSYEMLQYPATPALFVRADNTVGIGTSYPPAGYKLAVAGNMIAEKIKVKLQGAWPDYVFSKEYSLPSLQELDRFIVQNGHLPDVPSADEVEKEGIDMEEMNKALLRKIEELTLYLIEMDKKVSALQEANKVLEKKLNP